MNFKKIKHIHFIGIGGSGMIGIARVLLKKGYKVSGSDITETLELKKLKKNGAKVYIGHNQANIKNHAIELLLSLGKMSVYIWTGIKKQKMQN